MAASKSPNLRRLVDAVRLGEAAPGNIDEIRFQDALTRNVDPQNQRRIPAGCSVYMRGWIFTPPNEPASEVFMLLGADVAVPLVYGDARWDIASHYNDPKLQLVGFRGIFPLSGLPLGSYDVCIAAFGSNIDEYNVLVSSEHFQLIESHHLFPGKRVAPKGSIELSIDSVETYGGRQPQRGSLSVRRGETVVIRGWAVDRERTTAGEGIFARIDGKHYFEGVHGLPRHDVALALDMFGARRCGFTIRLPIRDLSLGSHKLEIIALAADGVSYSVTTATKLAVASR